jgi:hypothetical protein
LPQQRRIEIEQPQLYAPTFHLDPMLGRRVEMVRQAIASRHRLDVAYLDKKDQSTRRVLRPLGLYFLGNRMVPRGLVRIPRGLPQFLAAQNDRVHRARYNLPDGTWEVARRLPAIRRRYVLKVVFR